MRTVEYDERAQHDIGVCRRYEGKEVRRDEYRNRDGSAEEQIVDDRVYDGPADQRSVLCRFSRPRRYGSRCDIQHPDLLTSSFPHFLTSSLPDQAPPAT